MEKKLSDTINNVCTILGGALMLYPLIDEATKTLIPEMQKLASGEIIDEVKALPMKEEKSEEKSEEKQTKHGVEPKKDDTEIETLKRKLAELESKSNEQNK